MRKHALLYFVCLMVFASAGYAQEIVLDNPKNEKVTIGIPFIMKITLSKVDPAHVKIISESKDIYLNKELYFTPQGVTRGEKIVVQGHAVQIAPIKNGVIEKLKIGNQEYLVESGVEFSRQEVQVPKQLSILPQKIEKNYALYYLGAFVLLLVITSLSVFLIKRRARKLLELSKLEKSEQARQKLLDYIQHASGRSQLQYLYDQREKLQDLNLLDEDSAEKIKTQLEKIRYKKDWSGDELDRVKTLFQSLVKSGV